MIRIAGRWQGLGVLNAGALTRLDLNWKGVGIAL